MSMLTIYLMGRHDMPTTTHQRLNPGDPAPNVDLLDSDGNKQTLADIYESAPLALLFLRHLG